MQQKIIILLTVIFFACSSVAVAAEKKDKLKGQSLKKTSLPLKDPGAGHYKLMSFPLETGGVVVVKVNTVTGKAWYSSGRKWRETVDLNLPISRYVFKAVPKRLKGWYITRMDAKTGQAWTLQRRAWRPIQDEYYQETPAKLLLN
jgi:hypothetical protein